MPHFNLVLRAPEVWLNTHTQEQLSLVQLQRLLDLLFRKYRPRMHSRLRFAARLVFLQLAALPLA